MQNRKQQIINIADAIAPEEASSVALRAPCVASSGATRPNPEVVATAKRRSFSKAEKQRILIAADACVAVKARSHVPYLPAAHHKAHALGCSLLRAKS